MGDEYHRAPVAEEVVLEPLDGLDVEVVGRLVQQEDIGLGQQDLGKLHAHVPALREGAALPSELALLETEAHQGLLGQHGGRLGLGHGQLVVELVEFLYQPVIGRGLVVCPLAQFAADLLHPLTHGEMVGEDGHGGLDDRGVLGVTHYLGQIAHGLLPRLHDGAGSRTLHTGLLPVADVEADVVQEGEASEGYCEIIYRYHF